MVDNAAGGNMNVPEDIYADRNVCNPKSMSRTSEEETSVMTKTRLYNSEPHTGMSGRERAESSLAQSECFE